MPRRPQRISFPLDERLSDPLTIAELESGLLALDADDLDQVAFWDEHVAAFKQTVLLAIRDTTDALLAVSMPNEWREELEGQLKALLGYLELTDRYVAARFDDQQAISSWTPEKPMMN